MQRTVQLSVRPSLPSLSYGQEQLAEILGGCCYYGLSQVLLESSLFGNILTPAKEDSKMEKDEVDDILPDTDVDRERTLTGKWALGVFVLVFIFTTVAFCSPAWVEGDPRFYGTKLESVGLWVHCFRSLPDYNDLQHRRYFAGCRWLFNPFTEGYGEIRSFLAPRKSRLVDTN